METNALRDTIVARTAALFQSSSADDARAEEVAA